MLGRDLPTPGNESHSGLWHGGRSLTWVSGMGEESHSGLWHGWRSLTWVSGMGEESHSGLWHRGSSVQSVSKGWGGNPPRSVAWKGGIPPSLCHKEWDGRRRTCLERRRSECRSLKYVGTNPGLQISKRDRGVGVPKSQSSVFVLYGGKRKRSQAVQFCI